MSDELSTNGEAIVYQRSITPVEIGEIVTNDRDKALFQSTTSTTSNILQKLDNVSGTISTEKVIIKDPQTGNTTRIEEKTTCQFTSSSAGVTSIKKVEKQDGSVDIIKSLGRGLTGWGEKLTSMVRPPNRKA